MLRIVAGIGLTATVGVIYAADWDFEPRIGVDVIYSDNVTQAPDELAESGLVGLVQPGFSLNRLSGRLDFSLDYDMLNFFYSNENDDDTRHQLTTSGSLELIRERFFIDTRGSIRQELLLSDEDFGTDLIADPDAFTDVYAFSIGPRWVQNLGGYADINTRFNTAIVRYDEGAADADTNTFELGLTSGRRFADFEWEVNYFLSSTERDDDPVLVDGQPVLENAADSDRESLLGRVVYPLNDEWAAAARAGYENNDGQFDDEEDGAFWSVGGIWTPSRFIEAQAFYGPDENELSLRLSPTTRTDIQLRRRDRDVGIDTGVLWSGSLSHRTRYSNWSLEYAEETVDGSTLSFDSFDDDTTDDDSVDVTDVTDPIDDVDISSPLGPANDGLSVTSEDFRRQRLEASMDYARARTQIGARGFYEERDFAIGDRETAFGVRAIFTRTLSQQTSSSLAAQWEQIEFDEQESDSQQWVLEAAIAHAFSRDLSAGLSYRYAQRTDDEAEDEFDENRFSALMRLQF